MTIPAIAGKAACGRYMFVSLMSGRSGAGGMGLNGGIVEDSWIGLPGDLSEAERMGLPWKRIKILYKTCNKVFKVVYLLTGCSLQTIAFVTNYKYIYYFKYCILKS